MGSPRRADGGFETLIPLCGALATRRHIDRRRRVARRRRRIGLRRRRRWRVSLRGRRRRRCRGEASGSTYAAANCRPNRRARGAADGYCGNTPDCGAGCSPSEAALRRIRSWVWTARGKARKARNEHERTDHFHHLPPIGFNGCRRRARPGSRVDHKPARCAPLITNDLKFRPLAIAPMWRKHAFDDLDPGEVIRNHSSPAAVFSITVTSELSIVMNTRVLTAAAVATALAFAPAANAADWHRGWHGNYHRGGGAAVGAAIAGGIVGLGVGAAIASGGYSPYYYAPPPQSITGTRTAITPRHRQSITGIDRRARPRAGPTPPSPPRPATFAVQRAT